jgi:hypothetical protein
VATGPSLDRRSQRLRCRAALSSCTPARPARSDRGVKRWGLHRRPSENVAGVAATLLTVRREYLDELSPAADCSGAPRRRGTPGRGRCVCGTFGERRLLSSHISWPADVHSRRGHRWGPLSRRRSAGACCTAAFTNHRFAGVNALRRASAHGTAGSAVASRQEPLARAQAMTTGSAGPVAAAAAAARPAGASVSLGPVQVIHVSGVAVGPGMLGLLQTCIPRELVDQIGNARLFDVCQGRGVGERRDVDPKELDVLCRLASRQCSGSR